MARAAKSKKPVKKNARRSATESEVFSRGAAGVLVLGLGFLAFACLLVPSNATVVLWVRSFIQGTMGHLRWFLPLLICWAGALLSFSARTRVRVSSIVLISVLLLCVATMMQAFQMRRLSQELSMQGYLQTYKNFLWKSYVASEKVPVGGGLLGGFLAWPLTQALDVWGTFLLLLFVIGADLVWLLRVSMPSVGERMNIWARAKFALWREDREIRRQELEAQRAEEEAQYEEEPPFEEEPTPVPVQPARARRKKAMDMPLAMEPAQAPYSVMEMQAEPPVYEQAVYEQPTYEPLPVKKTKPALFIENIAASAQAPSSPKEEAYSDLDVERAKQRQRDMQADRPRRRTKDELPDFLAKKRASFTVFDELPEHMRPPEEEPVVAVAEPEAPLDVDPFALPTPEDDLPPWVPVEQTYESEPITAAPPRYEPILMDRAPELDPTTRLDMNPFVPVQQEAAGHAFPEAVETYRRPPYELLDQPKTNGHIDTSAVDTANAQKLEDTLMSFGVSAHVINVTHGPAITRFELQPAPGVKVSRIVSLTDDIALNMAAAGVRIEAPIPGKAAIGIEIPNDTISTVVLREVLESDEARRSASKLAVALGKDIAGKRIIADLARMPHVLIAGATGSGKSVCINTIITSIVYRTTPEEVRMILIDPKVVELSVYNGIPHLLIPVVTDPKKASGALGWAVMEMDDRYKKFAKQGVRDIRGYNASRAAEDPLMPQIVVIIDELADLMLVAPGEVEESICRLAQLARAAGIHLVIATQRPSVNVITGVIKANIPSRIAFAVSSQVDSRTILDSAGAEKLLGKGDMLYAPSGGGKPIRVQGCFVSDDEVARIVSFVKDQHETEYDEEIIEHLNHGGEEAPADEDTNDCDYDELLSQAVEIAVESGQSSISMLQRRLRVGYARAGRLIDEMARRGIVAQAEGAKPRQVLITREDYHKMFG